MGMIVINTGVSLPDEEIRFTFSRSSGPGGQNVNKVNSKATLWFDLENSPSLSDYQKNLIRQRLANRISGEGVLQVVAMQHRTQKANREEALQRFTELLAAALVVKPLRKKTRIGAGIRERRLQAKKRRSQLKTSRGGKDW
ncbi:MAG: alternative ribosome rescue aminoacyl-tRNA hydrolase ArfB [Desulfobulbaceae bacterium]